MKVSLYIAFFFLSLNASFARDVECCKGELNLPKNKAFAQMEKIAGVLTSSQIPKCFSKNDLSKEKSSPEKKLKQLMSHLSDEEIYKRLILAETMASTCPSQATAEAIAWVVKNRVNAKDGKRFGIGRDVVFKDYQFRSSTGDCDVAMTNAFMCPTSLGNGKWEKMWQIAGNAFEKTQKGPNPLSKESYQYFFYKHFDKSENCKKWKGVQPAWAKSSSEVKTNLPLDLSCIKVFK